MELKICFSGWRTGIDLSDISVLEFDESANPTEYQFKAEGNQIGVYLSDNLVESIDKAEFQSRISSGRWALSFSELIDADCQDSSTEIFDVELE